MFRLSDSCRSLASFVTVVRSTITFQEVDAGLTSVQRGCRSRKTLVHHISKDQHTVRDYVIQLVNYHKWGRDAEYGSISEVQKQHKLDRHRTSCWSADMR